MLRLGGDIKEGWRVVDERKSSKPTMLAAPAPPATLLRTVLKTAPPPTAGWPSSVGDWWEMQASTEGPRQARRGRTAAPIRAVWGLAALGPPRPAT